MLKVLHHTGWNQKSFIAAVSKERDKINSKSETSSVPRGIWRELLHRPFLIFLGIGMVFTLSRCSRSATTIVMVSRPEHC